MKLPKSAGSAAHTQSFSYVFSDWFPTPRFLLPPSVGIDISDSSIKWMALTNEKDMHRVLCYGDRDIPEGIVQKGVIKDIPALAQILLELKSQWKGIDCAHAALPEEAAYVFSMHVPQGTARDQTMRMIEFELENRVPIPPSLAVYDYNVIVEHDGDEGMEIGVTVFARDFTESYVEACQTAGINLLSLEVEARSIARAVTSPNLDEPVTLLVDFGRQRTGFAVLKRGVPIFTSTVDVGGSVILESVMQKLSFSLAEAEIFKNNEGLLAKGGQKSAGVEAVVGVVSALADEVARHYHYWDTRRNEHGDRMTPVGRVIMVGGSVNLKGLTDYIAGRVQAETIRGNVWQNVCSFDDYIPPLDRRMSLQYATAVGLAMRGIT